MTVPHLLHVFSTFVPAGPEVRSVDLMRAFGRDFRHSILAVDGRTTAAERLADADLDWRLLEPLPRVGSLRGTLRMRALLREQRPDLLLTYNWGAFDAVMAARSLGWRHHVHHEDGFTSDEAAHPKRRRDLFRRLFLPGAARVLVPSRGLEEIATGRWRLPAERVRYVPNGVELARFGPRDGAPELRGELGIPPDAVVVGSVGHLRPEKNPARLLEAARHVARDVHVLVLGDGPERARLEDLARAPELAGRVHLAGHRDDVAPWYRAMDLFCIPSDTEQMPVAMLEAMATGVAVVATDVGDVRRILPAEQAPFVVPMTGAETARALGAKLDELAARRDLQEELGRANRARVAAEFTREGMLAAHRTAWEDGLRAGPLRPVAGVR